MRKRNVRIQFWLDKKESESFDKKVKRSGLSREVYLRHLINGVIPRDAPPPDYYTMMRELYRIGDTLDRLERKAPVLSILDAQQCSSAVQEVRTAVREITKAVVLPQPAEK